MPKEAKDGSPLKHITIKNKTHAALNRIGYRGETFDDIIWRLIGKENVDGAEVVEEIVENIVETKTVSKTPKGDSKNKKKKDSTLNRKKKSSENQNKVSAIPPTKKIEKKANLNTSALERLLRSLGLEETAGLLNDNQDINAVRRALSPHVGVEPRDMRLDRLLRLSLRLMPNKDENDEKRSVLLGNLADLADILSHWTRTRLEGRNNGSKGHLIDDALKLGIALKRIPGPGAPIPLDIDEYELPKPNDIEGLSNEVSILKRRVALAKSGGVN